MKQIKFELKNKLKVILVPSHKSPVVSVQMWVKTGSADEPKGMEGVSHFIEHLVFKGTRKYNVGEIASIVEASGGELNAYTSFDQTVFYVTISKNYSNVALDVISEMMGHPTFIPAEVDSEREVVCEEIKMGQDSPGRSSSQLMFKSAFKKHAYGIPVIGYEKNVRLWPTPKIKKFYQSRYVPSNMVLIVSGDFEPAEMKKEIVKMYSDFAPLKLKKMTRKKEPAQKKATFTVLNKKITESYFQLALPVPNVKHNDVPAMDILALVLGQGETSRLYAKMRLENTVLNSISCFNYNPQDAGLFAFSARYSDQSTAEIFNLLFTEIEKIKTSGISWDELRKAILNISSEQFYSIETVDGIANKIGSAQFYLNDTNAHEKYLKQIQKITPQQVQKIAQKYFVPQKSNYSLMGPASDKQNLATLKLAEKTWLDLVKSKQKIKAQIDKKIKIPKIEFKSIKKTKKNDIEVFKTPRGTDVLFLNSTEIPTATAKIIFGGGSRLETKSQMGLTEMLNRTLVTQTENLSEKQILKQVEDCAAEVSAFGGKNTTGFSIDYMKPFEKQILKLSADIIKNPVFSVDIFNRERTVLENQILAKQDQPSYLCGRQFNETIFAVHPVSFNQTGTAETLKNITTKQIADVYHQIKSEKNMQVAVVGDFNRQYWMNLITEIEDNFQTKGRRLKTVPFEKLTENKSVFLEKDKEQSHVIVGWQALSLTDPDRHALEIIQAVMAGQGGRLFIELRDKNSLAYSVSPIKMESLECGYFGGYIACSPDKVEKALGMFHDEFKKISTDLVSEDELSRAQKYLIGQHDIGLQRKSSICNLIAFDHFYGNDIKESMNIAATYQKITREQVRRLAEKIFSKPHVTSVVGKK
jgi:zinc protease